MTFTPHYLLSWGGNFDSDPTEIWNNNLRFAPDDNLDGTSLAGYDSGEQSAIATSLSAKVAAFMALPASGYSSNVNLKYVKFNRIDGAGHYQSSGESHTHFVGGSVHGTNGSNFPITSALVVTMLTSVERGKASRGRVFVPHPWFAVGGTDYRITAANATQCANAWGTFLHDISNPGGATAGGSAVPSVVSNLGSPGPHRTINQCQVGNFVDYMGSRRNRLTEVRYTSAVIN